MAWRSLLYNFCKLEWVAPKQGLSFGTVSLYYILRDLYFNPSTKIAFCPFPFEEKQTALEDRVMQTWVLSLICQQQRQELN